MTTTLKMRMRASGVRLSGIGVAPGRCPFRQHAGAAECHRNPEHTSEGGQQHGLGQHLANEPRAASAHGKLYGKASLPRSRPCQQKICYIRARYQEHHHSHTHQKKERLLEFAPEIRKSLLPRFERQGNRLEPAQQIGIRHALRRLFEIVPIHPIHDRGHLSKSSRFLNPHDELQPENAILGDPGLQGLCSYVAVVVVITHVRLHRQRHPEVGLLARSCAKEPACSHTDNGERHTVHGHLAADHSRIAGKAALPVAVADNSHWAAAHAWHHR